MSDIVVTAAGDPLAPTTWSGIPRRLAGGLGEQGYGLVPFSSLLPRRVERLRRRVRGSHAERLTASLRTLKLSAASRRVPDSTPWLQLGSEARPPSRFKFVTYDDLTVSQARRFGFFAHSDDGALDVWQSRQGKLFRDAFACATASRWAADSLIRDYGVPARKIEAVGFGHNVDLDAIPQRDWDAPRFLFVGYDWERKSGPVVLAAFARLRRERREATLDVVSDFVGPDLEGVRWHGTFPPGDPVSQARLRELFATRTCFVMPSVFEPWGIVYLEAAAHGIASIGASSGGAPEAIGPSGISVDPEENLVLDAMRSFVAPDVARERGLRARDHAGHFTWGAVAGRIAQMFPD